MTRRRRAKEEGLEPHFLVRVVLPGFGLHLASHDEPRWVSDDDDGRRLEADWIDDPAYGDTIVSIEWSAVIAVTYRWSE